MKSIGPEDFFNKITVHSGISDVNLVRDVYYGLIKTISRELKEAGTIKLPDWGDFTLKVHKSRKMIDVNEKIPIVIPAKTVVKFNPDYKVKAYFHEFGSQSTVI